MAVCFIFLCYSVFLLINYFFSKNILLLFFYASDLFSVKILYGVLPEGGCETTSQICDDVKLQDR